MFRQKIRSETKLWKWMNYPNQSSFVNAFHFHRCIIYDVSRITISTCPLDFRLLFFKASHQEKLVYPIPLSHKYVLYSGERRWPLSQTTVWFSDSLPLFAIKSIDLIWMDVWDIQTSSPQWIHWMQRFLDHMMFTEFVRTAVLLQWLSIVDISSWNNGEEHIRFGFEESTFRQNVNNQGLVGIIKLIFQNDFLLPPQLSLSLSP